MSLLDKQPTCAGGEIEIFYEADSTLASLLVTESMDALITSAEGGLGPLPVKFLSQELGISTREIIQWANEISSRADVTMVALRSRKQGGKLRGAILVPFGTADCCKTLVAPENRGLPWRDLYYNITFESIVYACRNWQATKLVTNHLSGCGQECHPLIAACQCEALAHFAQDATFTGLERFGFLGCGCGTIKCNSFSDLSQAVGSTGRHRTIDVSKEPLQNNWGDVIRLKW